MVYLFFVLAFFIELSAANSADWLPRKIWNSIALPANQKAYEGDCEHLLRSSSDANLDIERLLEKQRCPMQDRSFLLSTEKESQVALLKVLENSLLTDVEKKWKADLTCENNFLKYFDRNPFEEIGDFCSGKVDSPDKIANLSPQMKNQIQIAKDTLLNFITIQDLEKTMRNNWPKELSDVQNGKSKVPPYDQWVSKIQQHDCSSYARDKAFPTNDTQKNCLYALLAAHGTLQDSVWNIQNPRMSAFMKFWLKAPGKSEKPEVGLRQMLCGSRSIYSSVISPSIKEAKDKLKSVRSVRGNFEDNTWFAREAVQSGRVGQIVDIGSFKNTNVELIKRNGDRITGKHVSENGEFITVILDDPSLCSKPIKLAEGLGCKLTKKDFVPSSIPTNPMRLYLAPRCSLEGKYGVGSDITTSYVDVATTIGSTVATLGASSLFTAGVMASKTARAVTVGQRLVGGAKNLSRIENIARGVSFAFNGTSLALQSADAVESCFKAGTHDLRSIACEAPETSLSKGLQAQYESTSTNSCVLNLALSGLSLVGLKANYSTLAKKLNNSAALAASEVKASAKIATDGFTEVKKLAWPRGIDVHPGKSSNIGNEAIISTVDEAGNPQTYRGWVVDDQPAFIALANEHGEVRRIRFERPPRKILMRPSTSSVNWRQVDLKSLRKFRKGDKPLYGSFTLFGLVEGNADFHLAKSFETSGRTSRQLVGRLTFEERAGNKIMIITDSSGTKHQFDMAVLENDYYNPKIAIAEIDSPEAEKILALAPTYEKPTWGLSPTTWSSKTSENAIVAKIQTRLRSQKNDKVVESFNKSSKDPNNFEIYSRQPGNIVSSNLSYLIDDIPQKSGQIVLLTPESLAKVPDGTKLWSRDGTIVVKSSKLSLDTRGGVTYYGFRPNGYQQLGDAIDYMDEGVSFVVRKSVFDKYYSGSATIGRPDGQFTTTKHELDLIVEEANGDSQKIAQALGLGDIGTEELIRVDVANPWLLNPRLPNPELGGANSYFLEGGKTSGGLYEIILDPVPKSQTIRSRITPRR